MDSHFKQYAQKLECFVEEHLSGAVSLGARRTAVLTLLVKGVMDL